MNILIYEWGSYTHKDIVDAFKKKGYNCRVVIHRSEDVNHDDEFVSEFDSALEEGDYEFVYSTNFFPLVAKCCDRHGLRYVSWSYDAPLDVPEIEKTLGLSCNIAYMYDREQAEGYRSMGFDNVYHLPLAVNTNRLDKIILSAADRKKYGAQLSFVGNLYDSQMLNIRSVLSDHYQGYLDALMKAQGKIYGCYFIDDILTDTVMEDINGIIREASLEYRNSASRTGGDVKPGVPVSEIGEDTILKVSREALSYAMAAQITRDERVLALKLLSNHYEVKLYSREKNELLDKVKYMGTVDYDDEMPRVFKASDINLNMTLRCIRSGIPLRALDIMGAGGFLLSNYQPELAENFINGEEAVMYDSIEDMYDKVRYYIANPEVRHEIALRGHEKTVREYSYSDRLDYILNNL